MAQVLNGTEYLSFFRRYKDRETKDASYLRFVTESSISAEKENDSTATVDGPVNSVSDGESTASFTSLAYKEEGNTIAAWKTLKEWFDNNEKVEFWHVDRTSLKNGKVEDVYHQGYFTTFEMTAAADGKVELNYEYAIDGKGVAGESQLTDEQLAVVERMAQYDHASLQALNKAESARA
ncbi:phage tail tube protein [Aerococcus urinae]|uniref:phage tail tube protein n=1 Tax=Aerococcus urinae TaxID=1376 RepID=UPI00254A17E4|nr:phage tail tube protein [Aerococcus urinae]MDK6688325.1 phage tail tube protein [Aerococcus urinae]